MREKTNQRQFFFFSFSFAFSDLVFFFFFSFSFCSVLFSPITEVAEASNEVNYVMKKFSAVATIFIPLTLVTGLVGFLLCALLLLKFLC